jgi:hypothetical protein
MDLSQPRSKRSQQPLLQMIVQFAVRRLVFRFFPRAAQLESWAVDTAKYASPFFDGFRVVSNDSDHIFPCSSPKPRNVRQRSAVKIWLNTPLSSQELRERTASTLTKTDQETAPGLGMRIVLATRELFRSRLKINQAARR